MNSAPLRSVVLLDDERSFTNLLTQVLSDHLRCRVVAFTRPLEALAALPGLNPGLIVTDYHMPQLNGFEFIAQASALVPGVPFILITGHTLGVVDREELATVTPLQSILFKPFKWQVLGAEIIRLWPDAGVTLTRDARTPPSG